jgi:glycosyltransferase involved in cell wall biosynthesis
MPRDYFYELSTQQARIGHKVDVITWKKDGGFSEEKTAEGFTIHRLRGLNFSVKGMIQEYPYLPSLPNEIEKLKPDVVHVESYLFLTAFQAIKKANKSHLPSVVTVHGVFAKRDIIVNFAQYAYLRSFGLRVLLGADRVICLTRGDSEEVIRFGCPPEKIRLIPNAVDTEIFKPCKERENNLVVWDGRFVAGKGLEYLIEAAKVVLDKFEQASFLLIGYGPLKSKIMKSAYDRGMSDKSIRFKGPYDRDNIAEILGKATVFVFPSLREGLPVSVLEAMAAGVPVVGSAIPGINDVVVDGENGYLVPPKDPKALASAMLKLLNDERLQRKLGQNARQLMIEKYSWDIVIREIEKVYREAGGDAN